jgi:rifampicin phosphotransferase
MARFYPLSTTPYEQLNQEGAGGKASGLARLAGEGFRTPPGFVILDSGNALSQEELGTHLEAIGPGPYAVRSSASDEDGDSASFAGQYVSVLNVTDLAGVVAAIHECEASLESVRAQAYRDAKGGEGAQSMGVVVQAMIAPKAAGVLFTADPVTGRRDRVVVDAVAGLGEALVSGHSTPDHILTDLSGRIVVSELTGESPILRDDEVETLVEEALKGVGKWGHPLDFEWAIDEAGVLWWLQARPITQLLPDPRELDTKDVRSTDVYTRCNIGEMMPGAVSPLTRSITARGIDVGLQSMMIACGVQKNIKDETLFIGSFFNHLFLNLTTLSVITTAVAGSTTERLGRALCGRTIPEVDPGPEQSKIRQAFNGVRYGFYLMGADKAHSKLTEELHKVNIPGSGSAADMFTWLETEIERLYHIYTLHLQSSAASGAFTPALLETLSKGEIPTEDHHAQVAGWIRVEHDVESADIAGGMATMVKLLQNDEKLLGELQKRDDTEMVAWLESDDSGKLGTLWREYIQRHGHRVVRELELYQKEWAADPTPLLAALRQQGKAKAVTKPQAEPQALEAATGAIGWLVKKTQASVQVREKTKSQLALMTTHLKKGFRELGKRLVAEGKLEEAELIFFLGHDEVRALMRGQTQDWDTITRSRRKALEYQSTLRFTEVFTGAAEPWTPDALISGGEGWLRGKPVSRGYVEGPARVVTSLTEALEVEAGEILIAPVTDVGWTPCFGVIAGVATEVGSAVSHGAVVAREYGLPGVVNVQGATHVFKTGEMVVLDADRGLLYRKGVEPPE